MGRFAWFVRHDRPQAGEDEVAKRVKLAYAMLMTLRGVPVIYYGDEQGFAGTGGDQDARQDLFNSFNPQHPMYRYIAELSALRAKHAALRGGRQIVRNASDAPGLFAVSRLDPSSAREIVVAFNTSTAPLNAFVEVDSRSRNFTSLHGGCKPAAREERVYPVAIPPLDFIVCAAGDSP
jgi:glycosidase